MDFRSDPSVLPPEQRYSEMARRVADPVASRGYRDLAKTMTAGHAQLAQRLDEVTAPGPLPEPQDPAPAMQAAPAATP